MTPPPPSSDPVDETLRFIRRVEREDNAETAQDRHRTKVRRAAQRRTRRTKQ
jgi:hypothetical protein